MSVYDPLHKVNLFILSDLILGHIKLFLKHSMSSDKAFWGFLYQCVIIQKVFDEVSINDLSHFLGQNFFFFGETSIGFLKFMLHLQQLDVHEGLLHSMVLICLTKLLLVDKFFLQGRVRNLDFTMLLAQLASLRPMANDADLLCHIESIPSSLHHHIKDIILLRWQWLSLGVQSLIHLLYQLLVDLLDGLVAELNHRHVQFLCQLLILPLWDNH